jgi:hypothetical protein
VVCKIPHCSGKNYVTLISATNCIIKGGINKFYPQFDDHDSLLDISNWTQEKGNKFTFKYGKIKIKIPDDFLKGKKNFLTFFIEHIKAYKVGYK